MSITIWIAAGYLIVMNGLGLLLCGIDKKRARKQLWRIPEKRFFQVAIVGGGVGVFVGMQLFHHKTRHPSFMVGIPAMIFADLLIIYLIYNFIL